MTRNTNPTESNEYYFIHIPNVTRKLYLNMWHYEAILHHRRFPGHFNLDLFNQWSVINRPSTHISHYSHCLFSTYHSIHRVSISPVNLYLDWHSRLILADVYFWYSKKKTLLQTSHCCRIDYLMTHYWEIFWINHERQDSRAKPIKWNWDQVRKSCSILYCYHIWLKAIQS